MPGLRSEWQCFGMDGEGVASGSESVMIFPVLART